MANVTRHAGKLAGGVVIAGLAVLLQGCSQKAPSGPPVREFAVDLAGAAKHCDVPTVSPDPGKDTKVAMTVGSDGGWCAITVANAGKPYDAGLLKSEPSHGTVLIHTVGNNTRIDYTPQPHFVGPDAFTVQLLPGSATLGVGVTVVGP